MGGRVTHGLADVLLTRTAYCVHCFKLVPELVKGAHASGYVKAYGRSGIVTASWCSRRCRETARPHGCGNVACYGAWRVNSHGLIAEGGGVSD